MAVHKFETMKEAITAHELETIKEGDFYFYRIGDGRSIVCGSEGRAMASCGWEHDAVRIAEALDNVS